MCKHVFWASMNHESALQEVKSMPLLSFYNMAFEHLSFNVMLILFSLFFPKLSWDLVFFFFKCMGLIIKYRINDLNLRFDFQASTSHFCLNSDSSWSLVSTAFARIRHVTSQMSVEKIKIKNPKKLTLYIFYNHARFFERFPPTRFWWIVHSGCPCRGCRQDLGVHSTQEIIH